MFLKTFDAMLVTLKRYSPCFTTDGTLIVLDFLLAIAITWAVPSAFEVGIFVILYLRLPMVKVSPRFTLSFLEVLLKDPLKVDPAPLS